MPRRRRWSSAKASKPSARYLELHDGLPGVATLGAQNLINVGIGYYRRVIILVDRDENGVGQAGADQLKARLRRQGIGVELALPPIGMKDWNDCRASKSKSKLSQELKQDNPDNPLNRPTPKTTGGGGTSKPIKSPTLKARKEANRAQADKYCTATGPN